MLFVLLWNSLPELWDASLSGLCFLTFYCICLVDQVSGTEILRKNLTFFCAMCPLTNAINFRRPPSRKGWLIAKTVKTVIADISATTLGERERNLLNLSVYIFGFPCWLGCCIPMSTHVPLWEPGALRINFGKGWFHPLGIREPEGGRGGGKGKGKGTAVFLCLDDLSLCLSGGTGQPLCVWCQSAMLPHVIPFLASCGWRSFASAGRIKFKSLRGKKKAYKSPRVST